MLAGKKVIYSVPLYTKGKKQIPVETKVVLGKWDGKNALYGISRDISARLKAEKKIRSSKARWQFALESSGDGIWDWRTQTNKVFFSTQWKKMLGYEESEISDSLDEWKKRIHPKDIKEVEFNLDAHLKGKTSIYQNEHRLLCKNGKYKWILDRGKIINRDAKGNPERIIGTHTDISARKYVENSMTQALQKEKELNELKSQFVSMASHEFRMPLATMIMAAETLELHWNKMSKEEITVKIERIKNNVKFLKNIIEKTLNLSRLQSGKLKFVPVKTELNQFIKEIIKHLKPTYNSHKINYNGTKVPLNLEIDRQMMKQVINNLLTNSFKYSEAGTIVEVNVSTGDSTVLIKITDEGIGIPESEKNNVFEAFQRCSNVGNIHGTGLGMTLANQFVQHHSGNISFKSEINKGTTFIITIPNYS
jgi:PAS domain S-box-containing protein